MADKLVSAEYLRKRFAYYASHNLPLERDCYLQAMKEVDAAPAVEPECKSADEMFRELGYTVKKHSEILESTMYSKPKNRNKTVDEISCDRNGVFTAYHKFGGFETYCMNSREILACAQLIKEMEVSDRAQTMGK